MRTNGEKKCYRRSIHYNQILASLFRPSSSFEPAVLYADTKFLLYFFFFENLYIEIQTPTHGPFHRAENASHTHDIKETSPPRFPRSSLKFHTSRIHIAQRHIPAKLQRANRRKPEKSQRKNVHIILLTRPYELRITPHFRLHACRGPICCYARPTRK